MRLTRDRICRGALTLLQPERGYRFNLDSVLLARFALVAACQRQVREVVDLGAGCGIVGLLLARWMTGCRVLLVELQADLADLARANARRNGLDDRVEVRCADLRHVDGWMVGGPALVVSNPPFFKKGAGQVSGNAQMALAKHEVACSLPELVAALAAGVAPGGAVALVYSADRGEELLHLLRRAGLGPCRIRRVLPLPQRPASRVLVLAERGAELPLEEQAALVVEERPGIYSDEMDRMLGEGA